MEIKAELNNATEEQRLEFIVEYNHNQGYTIEQETANEEEIVDEEGNAIIVYTYNLKALGYTPEELQQQAKAQRNREIDNKIQELQIMAIPEILNGNVENIKLYNDVIAGLEQARP